MTEIQQEILKLILEIDSICRKYDIEYYLEGGSALGAIRHGGFLPWDDDADLAMTRKNWEKFKLAMAKESPADRVLESAELNDSYPILSNRYINTATTNLWRSLMLDICACGLGIDIFVLEGAPDDEEGLRLLENDLIDYSEYINRFYRISSLGDSERYKKLRKLEKKIGRKTIAADLNEKILRYDETNCSRYLMRWAYRFQVYEKIIFGKPKYVPFEKDYMLPVPERTYEYLSYQFGPDWYMIPEPDNVGIHDTVLDLSTGYRKYTDQYMSIIDRNEALAVNQEYKDLEMEVLEYNKQYHHNLYSTTAKAEAYITNKACAALGDDLPVLFSEVSAAADLRLNDLFGNYLTKQLNQWYLFYHIFLPLDDAYLYVVLKYLLMRGEIRKADKLLRIRLEQPDAPSEEILQAESDLRANERILDRFWDDLEEDGSCACEILCPAQEAARICRRLLSCGEEELEPLAETIERRGALFPNEDLFKLAELLLSRRLHGRDCRRAYRRLTEETKNGMLKTWMARHEAELFNSSAEA